MENQEPEIDPIFEAPITHQFDMDSSPDKDELNFAEVSAPPSRRRRMSLPKMEFKSKLSKLIRRPRPDFYQPSRPAFSFKKKPMIIALAIFVLLLIGAGFFLTQTSKKIIANNQSDKRAEVPDAKSRQIINRPIDFPIKDSTGKEVTKIHYSIENAELHDQIVVQGQRATSVKGKTFLVINLKLTNDFDKPIQLNTKDYIRLTRNESQEQLAADIHNDPVTIQPISTKYTRLGFAINDTDKNLQLHVGEINGAKTTIDIKF